MKHRPEKKLDPYLKTIWGALIGAVCTLLLSLGAGFLLQSGTLSMRILPIAAYVIQGISALVACTVTALKAKKQRLLLCALTGGLYLGLLMIGKGLIGNGPVQGMLPTVLIVAGAILLSAILPLRARKRYGA